MIPARGVTTARSPGGVRSPAWTQQDSNVLVEWKKQLTAYVAWVNSQLKKKTGAHLVEDLKHDIRDGVALINLIEVIAGETLPDVYMAPSSHEEMRENVDRVLQFMCAQKIKMHHISTRDIVEGNLKATMRLVLALAAHYKPNSVRHSSQCNRQNITGIAQGAAAALTEARRNASRAGHRHKRRRHREEQMYYMDRSAPRGDGIFGENQADFEGRAELEGASAHNSPASSHNTSPRTSLYLSDPPSSMEGLLMSSGGARKGVMVTSCESDNAMGDSGYYEICDTLKETHQMLFHLHDLLLNGESAGSTGDLPEECIEGANLKETVYLLKGRLLHAEEIAESLRYDLNKVRKDCLELQGTKAGLQQRLKDQEGNISALRSQVMKLELENEKLLLEMETLKKQHSGREQVLSDVKISCIKQVEDKDKIIGDLRRELLNREFIINQLQEKYSLPEQQFKFSEGKLGTVDVANGSRIRLLANEELNSLEQRILSLTECLTWLDSNKMPAKLQTTDIEALKDTIQQGRLRSSGHHHLQLQQRHSSSAVDCLEDALVLLLDKLHLNGSGVGAPLHIGQQPGYDHQAQFCGNQIAADVSQKIQANNSLSSCSSGSFSSARSTARSPHSSVIDHEISPRASSASLSVARTPACKTRQGHLQGLRTPGSRAMKMHSAIPHDETIILYYIGESETHLTCVVHKKLGEITLKDFKSQVADSNQYHYFFKSLDPEYGTVKEELSNDDDVLPGWEGKIVAWLEADHGAES